MRCVVYISSSFLFFQRCVYPRKLLATAPPVYTTMGGHGKDAIDYVMRQANALCETMTWNEASIKQARVVRMARTAFQAVNSLDVIHEEWLRRVRGGASWRSAPMAARGRPAQRRALPRPPSLF